jgi:hypothetical protein
MRRRKLWIDVRAQIKAGRAAVLIGQNVGAHMNIRLPRDTGCPFDSSRSKSFPKRSQ